MWLATTGNSRTQGPMKAQVIGQYTAHLGRTFANWFPGEPDVTSTLSTKRLLRGVKRLNGDSKQRARPLTVEDLAKFVQVVAGRDARSATLRLVLLLLFWCCARTGGMLADTLQGDRSHLLTYGDLTLILVDGTIGLRVTHRFTKTIQFQQRTLVQDFAQLPAAQASICVVRAYLAAVCLLPGTTSAPNRCVGQFSEREEDCMTSASYLEALNAAVPARPPTADTKGHFTKHSARRGNAQAAMGFGMTLPDIMAFGDWASAPNVLNYVAGAPIRCRLASLLFSKG